jgi:hypothetical protein
MSINLQKIIFDEKIKQINDAIKFLEENFKAPTHDNNDFDWVIDNFRYSEAQDKIVFTTKKWEGDD